MEKANKDWFRVKSYPHIGLPILSRDKNWIKKYVTNPKNIACHSFLPFIHKEIIKRKFRKEVNEDGSSSKKRIPKIKTRQIYYANHLDSNIYSYYAYLLSEKYEQMLKNRKIEKVATAYRRIPLNKNDKNSRNMCSVDFANEIFEFIRKNDEKHLVAILFDIKSYFDNLDHKILKKCWCEILGCKTLDNDQYNVFRNITKFSYIEEHELFNELKNEIIVETKSGIRKTKKVDRVKYLRNQNAIAYCKKEDFKSRVSKKGYIKNNKYTDSSRKKLRTYGIPQGSPISSVLANIYLVDFDIKINEYIEKNKGIYRRYSDDIVIVCSADLKDQIIQLLTNEIQKYKLTIQSSKTQTFHFIKSSDRFTCFFETKKGALIQNRNFEYLGFQFDGYFAFLKSSSLASFYRKMKRTLNRSAFYAKFTKNKMIKGEIFRTRLYKKYSYLGSKRRRLYKRDKNDPKMWGKTYKYDWGNYLSYAYLASNNMAHNKIKHQVKNHWKILNELIKSKEKEIEKEIL